MSAADIVSHARGAFHNYFGRAPQWLASAPGRVNLIGEHTDYNNGFVLPMAIGRHVTVAAAPREDRVVRLHSAVVKDPIVIDLATPVSRAEHGNWANYPRGIIAGFLERKIAVPGFDALIDTTVPLGAGLSSSAALNVAVATLLEDITGKRLEPLDKVILCQQAETRYVGLPVGIMDPFASSLARAGEVILLDCRSQTGVYIPFDDPSVSILIVATGVKHELSRSEYPLRRAQCEDAARRLNVASLREISVPEFRKHEGELDTVLAKRARHVVTEIARTQQAAEELRARRWRGFGELMYQSHESLRVDFEVSCPELDAVVDIGRSIGVTGGLYGCRMTGGGFGGCAIALIDIAAADTITREMYEQYSRRTHLSPAIFTSSPAAGANS